DAVQHPERYAGGERWVLGDQASQSQGAAYSSADMTAQYSADFIKEWHQFVAEAHVQSCGGLPVAAGHLNTLSGPSSPLLQLFYTISHNTAVSDAHIKSIFQPAQILVDPNATGKLIGGGNG